jgi:hypothetical protein
MSLHYFHTILKKITNMRAYNSGPHKEPENFNIIEFLILYSRHSKMCTVEKIPKALNTNIFVRMFILKLKHKSGIYFESVVVVCDNAE